MSVHIDQDRITELLELDEDGSGLVLKDLISLFLKNLPGQLVLLNHAFKTRDFTQMKTIAHSISGSSLDLGAITLSAISQRIEAHGIQAEDVPSLSKEINQIQHCFEMVKEEYLKLEKNPRKVTSGD